VVDIAAVDGTDVSVTAHKRELKITFDDGTSKTISELLGTSVETIRNLFISLRQSYFATSIVDRIAWDIYIKKK
jgi:putative Mn2+ efflux pump MntP